MVPCQGTNEHKKDFEFSIKIPDGYALSEYELNADVTLNTDHLICVAKPCELQEQDESYPVYGIRLQGKLSMLASFSPVLNQFGEGTAAISKFHTIPINQVIYYTPTQIVYYDFNQITVESLTVTESLIENTLIINGVLSLMQEQPDPDVYAFTGNQNDNTISVIDTLRMTLLQPISLPYPPDKIAVSPDKAYTFVLHPNDNAVTMVSNDTLSVITVFSIDKANDIGFSPSSQTVYILSGELGTITVVDIETQTISNLISLTGSGFSSIAIDPNGQFAYIINALAWSILIVDLDLEEIVVVQPSSSDYPYLIEIDPSGSYAYVFGEVPKGGSMIKIFDLSSFTFINTTLVSNHLNSFLTFSPTQPIAILGAQNSDEINIIDTIQHKEIGSFSINNPGSAAFTPDGDFIYISQLEQNTVTVLSAIDFTLIAVIPVGTAPISIAI
jgi:DNA-binding beta-propeller fold protein YncE